MAKKSKGLPITQNVTTGKAAEKEIKGMEKDAKEPKGEMERERKWEVQDALKTIQRAEELKSDRQLMKDVKREAKMQAKALSKI